MSLADQVADLEKKVKDYESSIGFETTCTNCATLLERVARAESAAIDGVNRYLSLRRRVERVRSQIIDRLANVTLPPERWPELTVIRDLMDSMTDPKYLTPP